MRPLALVVWMVALVAAGLTVAGCVSGALDANGTHVVDGYYVGPEAACPGGDLCAAAVPLATGLLGTPGSAVVATSFAWAPVGWTDLAGRTHLQYMGGLARPAFVLFTLASGERRAVGIMCQPDILTGSGGVEVPASCLTAGDLPDLYLVGSPAPSG